MPDNIQLDEYNHHYAMHNGHIVSIDVVNSENRNSDYECLCCHSAMVPVLGSKKQHHFRHLGSKCKYEDYLHSMAELVIRDWMNITDHIPIIIDEKANCENYYNCIIRKEYENPTCIGIFRKWETIQVYSDI